MDLDETRQISTCKRYDMINPYIFDGYRRLMSLLTKYKRKRRTKEYIKKKISVIALYKSKYVHLLSVIFKRRIDFFFDLQERTEKENITPLFTRDRSKWAILKVHQK